MKIEISKVIPGLKVITPSIFEDFRGDYVETYTEKDYRFDDGKGGEVRFIEDDVSVSKQGTLRGLHGDSKTWKLIQCLWGEFYYVVVDMREESPHYLKWEAFLLNDRNRKQVLVPARCANGHLVLSEKCIFSYKQSEYYSGMENQFTIRWNDPKVGIYWPIHPVLISQRDAGAPYLK